MNLHFIPSAATQEDYGFQCLGNRIEHLNSQICKLWESKVRGVGYWHTVLQFIQKEKGRYTIF